MGRMKLGGDIRIGRDTRERENSSGSGCLLQERPTTARWHEVSGRPGTEILRRELVLAGKQDAQAIIAQDECNPEQDAEDDGEDEHLAGAEVGGNGTAEIAGE